MGSAFGGSGAGEEDSVGMADGVGGRAACPFIGLGITPVCIFSSTVSRCSWICWREREIV